MSLKTYIPSGIESNVASIRDSGSTTGANYFTTDLIRPTAISRNLKELEMDSTVEYELPVVPLTLPLYHSSGNNLKSRSFDYDFVLGNTNDTLENHFFILDSGTTSWFVSYLSKEVTLDFTTYKLTVHEANSANVLDVDVRYKCIDLSKYSKVMTSNLSNEPVEGYVLDYLDLPYTFEIEELVEEDNVQENGETIIKVTRTLLLTPNKILDEEEENTLRNIGIITAFSNEHYESNLRFAGKLDYESNLKEYFIHNSTTRYGNMRDFLASLNVAPHAVFVGKAENLKGLVFNLETFYNSDADLLEAYQNTPDSLGDSALSIYLRSFTYLAYEELFFKTKDNLTGTVNKLQIQTTSDTGLVEVLEVIDVTTKSPLQIYNTLLSYGLICLPLVKKYTTEVVTSVEVPGATPEDPPTQENVVNTVSHELLKGFYIKRFSCVEEDAETLQITFETNEEGEGYTYAEDVIEPLTTSLTPIVEILKATPASSAGDVLSKSYNLAKRDPQRSFSNLVKLTLSEVKEGTFRVANATSLEADSYNYGNTVNLPVVQTPFFDKGFGVEESLQVIKTSMETLSGISVKTSKEYAYCYVDAKNSSVKSVLVNTADGALTTNSPQCLTGAGSILLNFDTTKSEVSSFRTIPKLPYIVIDLFYASELHINPFSYITPEGVLKEQTVAHIDEIIDSDLFTSYEERTQYLENLSNIWSTSLLSSFLLPVVPLYNNNDEFSGCVAVYYDPSTIEGRTLENTLVKGDSEFLITNTSSLNLKYISGYSNSLPVYTNVTTLPPNISQIDQTAYFNIQSSSLPNLYSTTFEYSFNDNFRVNMKVIDNTSNTVESISIVKDSVKTLNEVIAELSTSYLAFDNSTHPNTFRVSIKSTAKDPRYVVVVENVAGGGLVTSKLISKTQAGELNVPLNRSV